jgi:hypothetical protein
MKCATVLFIVFLCLTNINAQEDYRDKYLKKKISGTVFTICGLTAGTIGTLLMVANSESAYSYSGNGQAGVGFSSAGGGIGLLLDLSAVPVTIIGIVKLAKGRRGLRRYSY